MSWATSSPTRGPGRPCSAEDDDYEVELTYGVLGLGSNVYEEKQSYATGTAYLKTVTRKYDALRILTRSSTFLSSARQPGNAGTAPRGRAEGHASGG